MAIRDRPILIMDILEDVLARSRNELLDLSTRNRLLSIPVKSGSARMVHCYGESSAQVFKMLVTDGKAMGFLPGQPARRGRSVRAEVVSDPEPEEWMPPPDDEVDPSTGIPSRQTDARLQTSLTPEALQRRLLSLYRDARTLIEEQGVNILYLAVGQLKWFAAEAPEKPYHAPLVLVPVELSRRTASEKFLIRWNEEDIAENLSLRAKLKQHEALLRAATVIRASPCPRALAAQQDSATPHACQTWRRTRPPG